MKFGYGKTSITPISNVKLAGYYLDRVSSGVLNDLEGRVLIFKDVTRVMMFISLDLIGIDKNFREDLLKLLCFKIKKEDIVISAIHTHSGPSGVFKEKEMKGLEGIFGKFDKGIYYGILNKIALLANEVIKELEDFTVYYGTTKVEDEYSERHDKNNYFNRDINCFKFVSETKEVLLYQINCHPTILHEDNLLISSDLIGGINKYLGENTFPLNGVAGDVSTRFTRVSSSISEIDRIGKSIASKIKEISYSKVKESLDIKEYDFSLKAFNDKKEYFKNLDDESSKLLDCFYYLKENDEISFSYQIIKFFNKLIITLPFEPLGSLFKGVNEKEVMIVGYTNGYLLYLPDLSHYESYHYEAIASLVKPSEGEALVKDILEKVEGMENEVC